MLSIVFFYNFHSLLCTLQITFVYRTCTKGKENVQKHYIEYSIYEAYILSYSNAKIYPSRFKYTEQIMQTNGFNKLCFILCTKRAFVN